MLPLSTRGKGGPGARRMEVTGPAGMSNQISDRRPGEAPATGRWPLQSGTVPPLADCYNPRPETGFGPMSNLAAGEIAVLTRPEVTDGQSLALAGGTGKTQLAVAFAHALWQGGATDLLVWVPATSRDAIVTGYAQALVEIGAGDTGEDQDTLRRPVPGLAGRDQPPVAGGTRRSGRSG